MQYYILTIDSLNTTFSIIESGSEIKFKFHYLKDIGDFEEISVDDFIIGYNKGEQVIKYVFRAKKIDSTPPCLELKKIFDTEYSYKLTDSNLLEKIETQEITKIDELEFISLYNNLLNNLNIFEQKYVKSDENNMESRRLSGANNTLLYGVPGAGKSWHIKNVTCKDIDDDCMERVVFHHDYTYSDFVGQVLPKVSENDVDYKFECGPFTSILRKAYKNPEKKFYLIIEEINRGNAPAIFGDIFQLLDRMEKDKDGFKKGTSDFPITNSDIADKVYGDEKHKVRIPSNLYIVATMNTSDQNVFTLDTAFKRRWNMKMIKNNFDKPKFKDNTIPKTNISWKTFGAVINELIIEENSSTLSSEDKRLGAFFVNKEELGDAEKFAEKVLMYLWDDAFKFSRESIFNKRLIVPWTLEKVISEFTDENKSDGLAIFREEVYKKFTNAQKELSLENNNVQENDSE